MIIDGGAPFDVDPFTAVGRARTVIEAFVLVLLIPFRILLYLGVPPEWMPAVGLVGAMVVWRLLHGPD